MANRFELTDKQMMFHSADAEEVLYGGAAGGGKSYAQVVDALLYAAQYPNSRQLILRRTLATLEQSLIPLSLNIYPAKLMKYNVSKRQWTMRNGSVVRFGYLDSESDTMQYQSQEYDVIRFDELTHFTEFMYMYMWTRLRGATDYPRSIKSSTNPGSVGHAWVKKRFIDVAPPMEKIDVPLDAKDPASPTISRVFIPAKVTENLFLMKNDPNYIKRLMMQSEKERKALLDGDWNIFEGQFFSEWSPELHEIKPFGMPEHWRRYVTIDYGFDMLAVLFIAVDEQKRAYVYREIYQPNLTISQAVTAVKSAVEQMGSKIHAYLAPPDLWNRRQETGKNVVDYFADQKIYLIKTNNNRVAGWRGVREWLLPKTNEFGKFEPDLKIFNTCINLIRTLPQLQHSDRNPEDVADEPHELTHAPDALRGFVMYWIDQAQLPKVKDDDRLSFDDERNNMFNGGRLKGW